MEWQRAPEHVALKSLNSDGIDRTRAVSIGDGLNDPEAAATCWSFRGVATGPIAVRLSGTIRTRPWMTERSARPAG